MKARILATTLLATGLVLSFGNAQADDELAAALVLGGTGAVIGGAMGGSDGAVVGGVLGALLGVAAADDDDRGRYYSTHYRHYRPRPPVYFVGPPPRYHWRYHWRHDHDRRWDRDDWRDDRRRWGDRDRRDHRDDRRGGHRGDRWDR